MRRLKFIDEPGLCRLWFSILLFFCLFFLKQRVWIFRKLPAHSSAEERRCPWSWSHLYLLASSPDNSRVAVSEGHTVQQPLKIELNMVTQTRVHLQTLVLLLFVGKYNCAGCLKCLVCCECCSSCLWVVKLPAGCETQISPTHVSTVQHHSQLSAFKRNKSIYLTKDTRVKLLFPPILPPFSSLPLSVTLFLYPVWVPSKKKPRKKKKKMRWNQCCHCLPGGGLGYIRALDPTQPQSHKDIHVASSLRLSPHFTLQELPSLCL